MALAVVAALAVAATPAEAVPFTATYTMSVQHVFGFDDLGLDGATLELIGWFDTTDTYAFLCCAGPGGEQIDAAGDKLVISGASTPGTNGTYTEADGGLGFFPNFSGQVFDMNGDTANYDVMVDGHNLVLGSLVAALVAGPSVGDTIDVSHFGTTIEPLDILNLPLFNWLVIGPQQTFDLYLVDSLEFRATLVSEPVLLLLFGVGLLALSLRRRR